ncbi:unnamed protein product [Musa hybrid cultivar]
MLSQSDYYIFEKEPQHEVTGTNRQLALDGVYLFRVASWS